MRHAILLFVAASLSACDRTPAGDNAVLPATPAAVTYDGADAPNAAARLQHGERLSWILGCKGCHGEDLRGQNVSKNEPEMGEWWAPNITLLMASYSDAELDRLIRHGEPKDGRTFYFMPAESLQYVSDADLASLLAYLRSVPSGGEQMPKVKKGPLFEKLERAGEFAPSPQMIARYRKDEPADLGERHRLGRYIAMTTCTECHNSRLQGFEDFSPGLEVVGAYDVPELEHLLTTGEGKVRKDLGLMSKTARNRFARLTSKERSAIITYVKALADRP